MIQSNPLWRILIAIGAIGSIAVVIIFYGTSPSARFSSGFVNVMGFLGPLLSFVGVAASALFILSFRTKGENNSALIWQAIGVGAIAFIPLLANWHLAHNGVKYPSRFQELDSGTAYDEKTHLLNSRAWRFQADLPEAPTKIHQPDFPPLQGINRIGTYEDKSKLIYVVGPRPAPFWRDKPEFKEAAFVPKLAKDECDLVVKDLIGKETNGHPISLENGKYQGYSSEGSCPRNRYYRVATFVDDQNQSDRVIVYYIIARGDWQSIQSMQTNQLFDSFKILTREEGAKI